MPLHARCSLCNSAKPVDPMARPLLCDECVVAYKPEPYKVIEVTVKRIVRRHSNAGWTAGCRCPTCTVEHREYQRRFNRRQYRRLKSKSGRYDPVTGEDLRPGTPMVLSDPKTGRFVRSQKG